MKILFLDIETAPMLGWSWDIWKEQGSMKLIKRDWYLLCWAVKWLDSKNVICCSLPDFNEYKKNKENDFYAIKELWRFLDEADVVVTQNGVKFDIPKINAKFIEHGINPPSPYKQVDTCLIARSKFGFSSNKLDDIAKLLKVGEKIDTGGFDLWEKVMEGDISAWKKMIQYNKNDVIILERIYKKMLPFIDNHPNYNIYDETKQNCPKCGSKKIQKRGFRYSVSGKKQQYHCINCGGWCSGGKTLLNVKGN